MIVLLRAEKGRLYQSRININDVAYTLALNLPSGRFFLFLNAAD
jgi:hypothetical protein